MEQPTFKLAFELPCHTVSFSAVICFYYEPYVTKVKLQTKNDPRLDLTLLPGGKGAGWIAKEVFIDDPDPMLVFGSDFNGAGDYSVVITRITRLNLI